MPTYPHSRRKKRGANPTKLTGYRVFKRCSLNHSLSASFIRVCQCCPVARKAEIISASYSMVSQVGCAASFRRARETVIKSRARRKKTRRTPYSAASARVSKLGAWEPARWLGKTNRRFAYPIWLLLRSRCGLWCGCRL